MVCENCGKEMIKIGELTEQEQQDFFYVNEKLNCAYQAQKSDVLKEIKFSDGQVYEYFKACYDEMAEAEYLNFIFYRNLEKRLGVDTDIFIDNISFEVFVHPEE